jgi:hypothetical protein
VTIATQLKSLDGSISHFSEGAAIDPRLNAEDSDTLRKAFSLAPPAFVDAWAQALRLSELEFTATDRDIFVRAIQTGTSRLRIIETLYAKKWTRPSLFDAGLAHDICRTQDQFVLIENLERFAPDDHAAFTRCAFAQICAREPTPIEFLQFDFDLRRGALERRAAVKKIVRIANQEGRPALWDSLDLEEDNSDSTCARTMPTGFAYDESGHESLIFVRESPEGGWMVAPDVLQQPPTMEKRGWLVERGWILAGPKRSLKPGRWRVDLNILQQEHVLRVDVVANAGLDIVQDLSIYGAFFGSFCITIENHHRFVELRIRTDDDSSPRWINPRNISMHRIS